MKKSLILAVLLLGTIPAVAQEPPYFAGYQSHQRADLERATTRYIACLESQNDGVVESGLAHIGRMVLYYPERSYRDLTDAVERIAINGRSPEVRYRAYLVGALLASPSVFAKDSGRDFHSPDELFATLAARLQQTMLGSVAGQ